MTSLPIGSGSHQLRPARYQLLACVVKFSTYMQRYIIVIWVKFQLFITPSYSSLRENIFQRNTEFNKLNYSQEKVNDLARLNYKVGSLVMPPKNVQVAVLVRPFTNREKEEDCSCIITAKDGCIEVYNRELDKAKEFNFDLSVRYEDVC